MKKLLLLGATMVALAGCEGFDDMSDFDSMQPSVPASSSVPASIPAQPPMPGGIMPASTYDYNVTAAAQFAAGQLGSTLGSVISAGTQVVAGTNYHLTIRLANQAVYQVVVYRNLQGQYQLTNINMVSAAQQVQPVQPTQPVYPRCPSGERWSPKRQMCLVPLTQSPDGSQICIASNGYYYDKDTNNCIKLFEP